MTLLDRVSRLLDAGGIAHALIGAAALARAGVARSTLDLDLLTTDRAVLRDPFWSGLRAEGVAVEVRPGDADDPLAGVVRLEAVGDRPVDVIVGRHGWQERAVRRAPAVAGGPPAVSPLDLVLLKLYAGGSQDLWDVEALLHLPGADALAAQVEAELANLPVEMREGWSRVRSGPPRG
jgi:hypothetical protein